MSALAIVRGDDRSFSATVTDENTGAAINLTGAQQLTFSLKRQLSDATYVLQKTLGSGVAILDPVAGTVLVDLYAAETALLTGTYVYDLELRDSGGKVTTVDRGTLRIDSDVTGPAWADDTALLSLAELKSAIASTSAGDTTLRMLLDAVKADLEVLRGPIAGPLTELRPGGSRVIFTRRPILSVTSVTEVFGTNQVALVSSQYQLRPSAMALMRQPAGYIWAPSVQIVYVPADDRAQRKRVQLALVKLDLAFTGLSSISIDGYSESQASPDYVRQRAAILNSFDGPGLP